MNKHCESVKGFEKNGTAASSRELEDLIEDSDGWAYAMAYKLAGNAEDAKELVQEALFRIVRAWDRYDGRKSVEALYLTVLRNLFYDTQRHLGRKQTVSLDDRDDENDGKSLQETIESREIGLEASLERAENQRLVHSALGSMSKSYRTVLEACCMEGLCYKDAAARLHVPGGTVRSRLSRARAAFRMAVHEINQGGLN